MSEFINCEETLYRTQKTHPSFFLPNKEGLVVQMKLRSIHVISEQMEIEGKVVPLNFSTPSADHLDMLKKFLKRVSVLIARYFTLAGLVCDAHRRSPNEKLR